MPDYNFTITVPANTSKENPVVTEMILTKGVVAGGQIFFPYGCVGKVHLIICDGTGQLYPANAEDTYHGEGAIIPIVGRHRLDSAPYKLYAKAWSPGTTYDHTIQLSLSVLTEEELTPYGMLKDLLAVLKKIIGL